MARIDDGSASSSGGGPGSTGGTFTPPPSTTAAATVSAAGSISPSSVNIGGIQVAVAVADVWVQCPAIRVHTGEKVFIKPYATNTKPLRVAHYQNGPYDLLFPGDAEREYPVDITQNVGEIWIMQPAGSFVLGEGLQVSIRRS